MSGQGIKRAALYSTALIFSLVLLSPYIFEKIANSSRVKHKVSFLIEQKTGVKINPDKIDFSFLPQPSICFRDQEVSFNPLVALNIETVRIDINMVKFIQGKSAVSKVLLDRPKIRYRSPKNTPDSLSLDHPFSLALPREKIQHLFALFPDSNDTLELVIQNMQTEYSEALNGSVFVSNVNQSLVLKAQILGLHVQKDQFMDTPFIENIGIDSVIADRINILLMLDGAGKLTGNLKITAPRVLAQKIPKTPLAGDLLDLKFHFSRDLLSVELNPVVLSYPRGRVGINFIDDKKAKLSAISFIGDDIDIAQAGQVCLGLIGSNEVVSQLFDILREGTAEKVKVDFSSNTLSTLFDGKNLFLTGSAVNSRVKIPETPLIAENVQGDAVLEKGVLHIQAKSGRISNATIKSGQLEIDLMNHEDIPFNGEFNLLSDLSTLPQVLISLLPDTLLAKELARVSQVSGQADGVLKLGMESMKKKLRVQVQAQILTAKGFYDRIPLPFIITKAGFSYDTDRVVIQDLFGSLEGSLVENLSAIVDFQNLPSLDISSGPVHINLDEILPWITSHEKILSWISPVKTLTGEILADNIRLEGPVFDPGNWRFDIKGSGRDIAIGFSPEKKQVKAVSYGFQATEKRIQIADLKAGIEDLSWLSHAIDLPNLKSLQVPLQVFGATFENKKDKTAFQGQASFLSGPTLSFDLIGTTVSDLYPRRLTLKDQRMSDAIIALNKDRSKALLNFEGVLNTQTLEKILIKNSFLHGRLSAFTMGQSIEIFTDEDLNLHLDTEKINLDSFKTIEVLPKKTNNQPLLDHKTLFLTSRHLRYKNRDFSDIEARISFDREKTQIQILNAILCNISATGVLMVSHETLDSTVISNFKIRSMENHDLADTLPCLLEKTNDNKFIDGSYSFTCDLLGQASSDKISSSQNGILAFNAGNGRIFKWTLLSRLLSVLNILQLADITKQGIGYHTIAVEAEIKESIIHLKKAVIDADNMALIFNGWIDPLNDKMDLTCLIAPFKTIDTLIKYIPVVNTMLSGRLISIPARATGSISDPVITALSPSAVGQGLVNTLEDILKTPVRLLEKLP
ncbi:MAG: AsmA-like C-terminal region-containing protein [Proteobacteria bacterium]|nr:hypothetical protein [Desulfobacula sp.]MBU3953808.1 AsmA-like C-terminal region-containing protein [Pseudomonadota bacterium]MBU4131603.1 AsmA-like C-terminal region-containing protein [Pseudomonadota bacterium]